MDFNDALTKVGDFGLYQILLCGFMVVPSASLCALVYFTQFFILLVPDHRCKLYEEDLYNDTISRNWTTNCEVLSTSDRLNATKCENGWAYDFSELYPTISTEMDWVCDYDQKPYTSQTIFYIGTSIGCIVFGLIADRFGRRPSIVMSYLIACIAGVGSAFTTSFYTFNLLRFLVGATIIPLSEDPYVLSLEYIGVTKRTFVIIIWSMGYIVFSAICPWIAYFIRDWRLLCIVTSGPLALVPIMYKLVPESASWLLTRGRRLEAVQLLRTVASVNGREPPDFDHDLESPSDEKHINAGVLDLFRTPRLRKNALIMAFIWFVVYCCYHTNTQNASNLGTNVYDSFTYSSLVEIPSLVIILTMVDYAGRRIPVVLSSLVAALAGLIIRFVPESSVQLYLVFALLQRVTITIVYNVIMQYSAEILPTALRGRGLAFLRLMGTMGLYLSPSIVYLSKTAPSLPLLLTGFQMFVVSVVALFLPETVHMQLPHTVQQGEEFGREQKCFYLPCVRKKDETDATPSELTSF